MTIFKEMDTSYEAWTAYHEKKDLLDPTHSLIDAEGPFDLYCLAIEMPEDMKLIKMTQWMDKEIDTSTRFSLTDGRIQLELEVWDGDKTNKQYFCVNLTLKQAINLLKGKHFTMGYVPVGRSHITVGATQIFHREDLAEFIRIKHQVDVAPNRPRTWNVG